MNISISPRKSINAHGVARTIRPVISYARTRVSQSVTMKGKGFKEGISTIGNTARRARTESTIKERHKCKLD